MAFYSVIIVAQQKTGVKASSLQDKVPVRAEINGSPVFIISLAGKIYAMDGACSHHGGPLEQGTMEDSIITCPWHGARFDVTTAKVQEDTPWATDLHSYKASVDQSGEVVVEL